MACGSFVPDQRSNSTSLHWRVDSYPWTTKEVPVTCFSERQSERERARGLNEAREPPVEEDKVAKERKEGNHCEHFLLHSFAVWAWPWPWFCLLNVLCSTFHEPRHHPWPSLSLPHGFCPCCSLGLNAFPQTSVQQFPSFHPLSLRVTFRQLSVQPSHFSPFPLQRSILVYFFDARNCYLTLFCVISCLVSVSPARI